MEELLTKSTLLDNCMKKYKNTDVMSEHQVKHMCLDERTAFNAHLFSDNMTMKVLIPERMAIMQAKEAKKISERRAFMDNFA